MRPFLFPTLLISIALSSTIAGCSTPSGEDEELAGTDSAALTEANNEFDDVLAEVARAQEQCEHKGKCAKNLSTASIQPLGNPPPAASGAATKGTQSIRHYKLCDALKPFGKVASPYFFVGGSVKAALIATAADVGVDLVFDLANQQAALFHYHNHGYQNLIGAEGSLYLGYGFGNKDNVLDAWAGDFQTAESTVEVASVLGFLGVSLGGFIFRSPDNSIWGGAAEVSFGVNALGPLGTVELSASEGFWTPWDSATTAFGNSLFLVSYKEESAKAVGKKHTYLQFKTTKDIALALVERLGPLGVLPAAHAAGLAALKHKKLTISQACSRR